MKAYTDIEQSKKLAEILPLESADMCYRIVAYNPNDTHEYQPYCFIGTLSSDIPCWSLATLLSLIPDKEEWVWSLCKGGYNGEGEYDADYFISFETFGDKIGNGGIFHCESAPNMVDAVFDMIIWLKEQKYI